MSDVQRPARGAVSSIRCLHVDAGQSPRERDDEVVVEEPLEIRVSGEPLAVTMRSPGHDHELVAGFLLSEGLIRSRADLGGIAHCGRPGEEGYGNVIEVTPAPGATLDPESMRGSRRGTLTTAACGVCGRVTIADLLERMGKLEDDARFDRTLIAHLTERLREQQPAFARTGGLHAAAIVSASGEFQVTREDIGRHNATDKAIGRMLLDGIAELSARVLVVSGRTSFEIVQKAAMARIPVVCAVSAPSSLAVSLARDL
ncbi:MAG TPA: formate dehydrogenase accessory sulfurtransferase FdhD, partial [Polyangiaceae bacterium]|nr:formate dehydrogenase accessory sulfurtransferase FdhD [Polyangiaceae bacterium]